MSDDNSSATNAKTLACQQCDKRYTRPENLARHMKTHESIQRHHCKTCGRKFTRSDLRKKHELLHERAVSRTRRQRSSRSKPSCSNSILPEMEGPVPDTTALDDQHVALMVSVQDTDASRQAQVDSTELDPSYIHSAWAEPVDFDPYFDYTTFARPWNYHLGSHSVDTSEWFSSQFFAALRETDLAYSPSFRYDSSNLEVLGALDHNNVLAQFSQQGATGSRSSIEALPLSSQPNGDQGNLPAGGLQGRISRVASPPNESSNEDRLPFAWDPRSRRIARAKPVALPADDPIFGNLDDTVEISQATLVRIKNFLRPSRPTSGEDTFTIPDLSLVNVFIALFFTKFSPQAPILHRPTLEIEKLPPVLLAIMIVIGSCYSRLRNTRRFGIIVFDRVRQNLLASIEEDNSLMREPLIIYAAALVCYMGLWCGNKRAFELSEALRAVVVTYIRRLPTGNGLQGGELYQGHQLNAHGSSTPSVNVHATAKSQWLNWVSQESQKRLRWFAYMIDLQFPAILGMSGMLTLADVRKWECPSDEEFWTIGNERAWKNRLGSASEPSCPIFGSLSAMLMSTPIRSTGVQFLPGVNVWSAHLLMNALMSEIFHYQETLVVSRTYEEEHTALDSVSNRSSREAHLFAMLDAWYLSYAQHRIVRFDTTSAQLQHCSTITYFLARIFLVFPISEIQDCLGRSGPSDSKAAMGRLSTWIAQYPGPATTAMEDASICIGNILAYEGESGPYDLIGLFLCHVIIWSFAHAAELDQKRIMVQQLRNNQAVLSSVTEVIEAGFLRDGIEGSAVPDSSHLVFRHAIQTLVQRGTWGASANLALLLHLHPGIPE